MQCLVCGGLAWREVFKGRVRAGAPGVLSDEPFEVRQCDQCSVQRLVPFPENVQQFYESPEYRDAYNRTRDQSTITATHADIRATIVDRLGLETLLGKSVADFGCAEGGLLDLLAAVTTARIGIEPSRFFHDELKRKGIHVFSYGRELVQAGRRVDVALSFAVIEHVMDPVTFVSEMYGALEVGGRLVLSTPNSQDILTELAPEAFKPFNYRTAHLHYFSESSLRFMLEKVGFRSIKIGFQHLYDLSNLLSWYRDGQPSGLGHIPLFDQRIDEPLRSYLEETGRASELWVEAVKP